jgi:hypothetical protein
MGNKLSSTRRQKRNILKFDLLILTSHGILDHMRAFLDVRPGLDILLLFLGYFVNFDSPLGDWLQQASGSCRLDFAEDLMVWNDQRDASISETLNNMDRNCRRYGGTDNFCNML